MRRCFLKTPVSLKDVLGSGGREGSASLQACSQARQPTHSVVSTRTARLLSPGDGSCALPLEADPKAAAPASKLMRLINPRRFIRSLCLVRVTAIASLRHFFFLAAHLLVAAQALLMIGPHEVRAPVIGFGARGVTCVALGHLFFRLKRAVMVAARAQRGVLGMKIGCQGRCVDALGQLLHNLQMLEHWTVYSLFQAA